MLLLRLLHLMLLLLLLLLQEGCMNTPQDPLPSSCLGSCLSLLLSSHPSRNTSGSLGGPPPLDGGLLEGGPLEGGQLRSFSDEWPPPTAGPTEAAAAAEVGDGEDICCNTFVQQRDVCRFMVEALGESRPLWRRGASGGIEGLRYYHHIRFISAASSMNSLSPYLSALEPIFKYVGSSITTCLALKPAATEVLRRCLGEQQQQQQQLQQQQQDDDEPGEDADKQDAATTPAATAATAATEGSVLVDAVCRQLDALHALLSPQHKHTLSPDPPVSHLVLDEPQPAFKRERIATAAAAAAAAATAASNSRGGVCQHPRQQQRTPWIHCDGRPQFAAAAAAETAATAEEDGDLDATGQRCSSNNNNSSSSSSCSSRRLSTDPPPRIWGSSLAAAAAAAGGAAAATDAAPDWCCTTGEEGEAFRSLDSGLSAAASPPAEAAAAAAAAVAAARTDEPWLSVAAATTGTAAAAAAAASATQWQPEGCSTPTFFLQGKGGPAGGPHVSPPPGAPQGGPQDILLAPTAQLPSPFHVQTPCLQQQQQQQQHGMYVQGGSEAIGYMPFGGASHCPQGPLGAPETPPLPFQGLQQQGFAIHSAERPQQMTPRSRRAAAAAAAAGATAAAAAAAASSSMPPPSPPQQQRCSPDPTAAPSAPPAAAAGTAAGDDWWLIPQPREDPPLTAAEVELLLEQQQLPPCPSVVFDREGFCFYALWRLRDGVLQRRKCCIDTLGAREAHRQAVQTLMRVTNKQPYININNPK